MSQSPYTPAYLLTQLQAATATYNTAAAAATAAEQAYGGMSQEALTARFARAVAETAMDNANVLYKYALRTANT